jgi:hypothetical protein
LLILFFSNQFVPMPASCVTEWCWVWISTF